MSSIAAKLSDQVETSNWGLLAQFAGPDELVHAIERLHESGYTSLEAYTPFPIAAVIDKMSFKRSAVPGIILLGGLIGGVGIYSFEYWVNVWAYPINIGGRPLHSWPAFIPPTFECIVLLASFAAIGSVVLLCGLPRLHHPLFEIDAFKRASTDGFFIAVRSDDEHFDVTKLNALLADIGAIQTWEVPDV